MGFSVTQWREHVSSWVYKRGFLFNHCQNSYKPNWNVLTFKESFQMYIFIYILSKQPRAHSRLLTERIILLRHPSTPCWLWNTNHDFVCFCRFSLPRPTNFSLCLCLLRSRMVTFWTKTYFMATCRLIEVPRSCLWTSQFTSRINCESSKRNFYRFKWQLERNCF